LLLSPFLDVVSLRLLAVGRVIDPIAVRRRQLHISSDHFFVLLSFLTTFVTELSDFFGQN